MVTAPISKEGFHRAGLNVPGHTEMLAELCGTRRFAMMLFGGTLRVVLATRHIPLADVPRAISPPPSHGRGHPNSPPQALPWLGARRGRVAVCGLNPHAGEGGDLGREEIDRHRAGDPRTEKARGLRISGPLPGDTVFHQAARGDYDAVVAMYHDQGLAPAEAAGLRFRGEPHPRPAHRAHLARPRHRVCHRGQKPGQRPASMLEAVRWAIRLAGKTESVAEMSSKFQVPGCMFMIFELGTCNLQPGTSMRLTSPTEVRALLDRN
jgi:hypothetical protein